MKLATIRVGDTTRAVRADDIIATGTPGGVGQARKPSRFLTGGETVVTEIEGIGRLANRVAKDTAQ